MGESQRAKVLADQLLSSPVGQYGMLDFDKMDEMVEAGYEYGKTELENVDPKIYTELGK